MDRLQAEGADAGADRAVVATRELARRQGADRGFAALARVVEDEIVPCLLREHGNVPGRRQAARAACGIGNVGVPQFAQFVLAGAMTQVHDYVNDVCAKGASLESVYRDLLAPAALHMNALWQDDRCAFSDVMIGMMRMQQVLRDLGPRFRGALECPRPGRRVLLVAAPGDQLAFNLFIVADFFATAGWEVWTGSCRGDDAPRRVRDEWFDIVGVSTGCADSLDELATEIGRIRAASRNPLVGIMVGGAAFVEHPDYVARVGADAMAVDGLEAPHAAERLLAQRASLC